jgi:hypothetical protein
MMAEQFQGGHVGFGDRYKRERKMISIDEDETTTD